MAITKWEPFGDLEQFFEDFSFPSMSFLRRLGRDLAVDVYEDGNNVIAEMQVPGIDPEKVNVEVEDGYVRVSGKREQESEKKDKHYYSKEIRHGSFERVFRVPDNIDRDNVTAQYEKGVLKVIMPKTEQKKLSKVTVQVKGE